MNWLQKFMLGRYGVDQMNVAVLILSMACTLTASFTRWLLVSLLGTLLLIWAVFRMFSRNLYKRQAENQKWLQARSRRRGAASAAKARRADTEHKYFTCKRCKTICRVPVGKGKVIITCPKCGAEIHGKT